MYYRVNTRKLSYKDFRTEASWFGALIAWLVSRLPLKLPCCTDLPAVDSLQPHFVPKTKVPEEIKEHFRPQAEELHQLGFRGTLYHHVEDPISRATYYFASYLHTSGAAICRLEYRLFHATTPTKKLDFCTFISTLKDGYYLSTTTADANADHIDQLDLESRPNDGELGQLWQAHRDRLRSSSLRAPIVKIRDGQHLLDTLEEVHLLRCQDLINRGIFVPVDEEELTVETNESLTEGPDVSPLVSEVRKIERQPGRSSKAMLFTLAVSLLLFVAAGGISWDWKFTLMLVPILLFHEAGHFVAMKMFDYQNVQMFFIPLFGAAVAGKHFNVPGWKRIVTSLMGPVPGILFGAGLGGLALYRGSDTLLTGALIMLFINGLNLLPVLPLDGGWIMHGLVFSRHAFLDFLFRIVAIGALFLGAVASGDFILYALGGVMIAGLMPSFHAARITDRLRADESFPTLAVNGNLPTTAIERIGKELDKAYPKGLDVRAKAKWVRHIFENVNSRPPGWLGSLLLGGVYLGSVAVLIIVGAILVLGKFSDLGKLAMEAGFGPDIELDVREIRTAPPQAKIADLIAEESLVMQFAEREEADAAFAEVSPAMQPGERLLLIGNTLILILPEEVDRERTNELFDRYDSELHPSFFSSADSPAIVTLTFVAPDIASAERVTDELSEYFAVPGKLSAVPPWHRGREITAAESLARRTMLRLEERDWMEEIAGEEEYYDAVDAARRRGQDDVVKQLNAERTGVYQKAFTDHLQLLSQLPAEEIDLQLVAAYQKAVETKNREIEVKPEQGAAELDEIDEMGTDFYYPSFPDFPEPEEWLPDGGSVLGLLEADDPLRRAYAVQGGSASPNGLFVSLHIRFECLPAGLLSLVEWLNQKGCLDLKYAIYSSIDGF